MLMDPDDAKRISPVERTKFEALLKPVLPMAFRYAYRLSGNRDSGMDLVQDASVMALRSFHQFEGGANFKAWYLRILTNRYYRTVQNEARTRSVRLDDVPELFLYLHAKRLGVPMEGDPTAFVFGEADNKLVCEALELLPDEYRVVATLHFLSEATYAECAEALDVPIGTVRSRLHRARKLLQMSLWGIAQERGYVAEEVVP